MLRLQILGSIDLRDSDGRQVHALLAQPKRLALLAYLAAARPTGFHRRDTLLALFWPEVEQPRARDALSQALRFLRTALGDGVLVTRGETVGLDRSRLSCDAEEFIGALDRDRPADALELYRGDLLEGFFATQAEGFEHWLERERPHYRAAAARAARLVAEQREAEGNLTTAVSCARRAVALSELDERVLRQLIELLDRLGDRAGALQAYEEFARRLTRELGATPAPETQALARAIRARNVATAHDGGGNRPLGAGDSDRWEVERELARTGMSTVYLARDLKHDRAVALKTMRPAPTVSPATERFLREIQITARLAHPHILPLLDSGVREGALYLVTPFVRGESLRVRLQRAGRLPIDEILRLAIEVSEALDYAHRSGVIHRDIKPENILLADGHAVVADFGVAAALNNSGIGAVLPDPDVNGGAGSRAYMSPEQAAGEAPVSHRADLYSFGVVVFEMLTGKLPVGGESADDAARPRPEVPRALAELVASCITASPEARPASAREVLARLESLTRLGRADRRLHTSRWVAAAVLVPALLAGLLYWQRHSATATLDRNLIAVLPFRVSAPDSTLNYLREAIVDLHNVVLTGEGIARAIDTRTILNALREASVGVGSAMTTEQSIAIARRLGAGRAIIGEVVGTSRGITMSAQLLNTARGAVEARHAESLPGDELVLTRRLISRLLAKSMGEATARLPGLSDSAEAVKAYLAGLQAARDGKNDDAFDLLGRALEVDSAFAAAAFWRANVGWGVYIFGDPVIRRVDSVAWSLRQRLSQRDQLILASRPTIGPHYPAPSTVTDILQALERAAEANSERPEVWTEWGYYLRAFGSEAGVQSRLDSVRAVVDRAIEVDSTYVPALRLRRWVAIDRRDTAGVRMVDRRLRRLVGPPSAPVVTLAIARVMGDTANLEDVRARVAERPASTLDVFQWAAHLGPATVDDAERVLTLVLQRSGTAPRDWRAAARNRVGVTALRGRPTRAIALADSLNITDGPLLHDWIMLGLAEPGYDSVARRTARVLDVAADTTQNKYVAAQHLCLAQLWHVAAGDTLGTRRAIGRMRDLIRTLDPGQAYRIGPLGLCPLLLEASLERLGSSGSTRARDQLESLMLRGVWEVPGNLANLIVARWREEAGQYVEALEIVRRRSVYSIPLMHPSLDRLEARLRTALGDTAGAVRAYARYLSIRDQPEPGPVAEQVDSVQMHLRQLTASPRGR